jgi:MYXO-CTERM domain-containing protein
MDTTASVCNGSGACTTATTATCAGYKCAGNQCSKTCAGAGDCAAGYWCSSGTCLPLNPAEGGLGGATGSAGAGSGAGGATGAAGGGGGTGARGGTGATNGASGSGSPDAGVSTGGAGAFTDVAKQDSGCGCRTARRADNRAGSLLVALGLAASLARRRRKQSSLRE